MIVKIIILFSCFYFHNNTFYFVLKNNKKTELISKDKSCSFSVIFSKSTQASLVFFFYLFFLIRIHFLSLLEHPYRINSDFFILVK